MRFLLAIMIVATILAHPISVAPAQGKGLLGIIIEEQERKRVVEWLVSQGLDRGAAEMLSRDKPALRQFLYQRSMATQDDAYCRSLGARPGTDAYVNCRIALTTKRR